MPDPRHPRDVRNGPEAIHELGHVVGSEVEQRSAAGTEQERRIWMARFCVVVRHERRRGEDLADATAVDDAPCRLAGAPQECVRSGGEHESGGAGAVEHRPPLLEARRKRLLDVDVLARVQALLDDRCVHRGRRQHDDELDRVVVEDRGRRPPRDTARAGRRLLCTGEVDVRAAHQLKPWEALHAGCVAVEDVAAADDPDGRHGSRWGTTLA